MLQELGDATQSYCVFTKENKKYMMSKDPFFFSTWDGMGWEAPMSIHSGRSLSCAGFIIWFIRTETFMVHSSGGQVKFVLGDGDLLVVEEGK